MTIKKKGLGRNLNDLGLNELLSDIATSNVPKSALRTLAIDLLQPGKYQPRRAINQETLAELADSIRKQGIIQPIVVRTIFDGSYEIIAGERRWRAAQLAGLHEVPVTVRDISDEQAMAMSLIENIQREDLNVIDTAIGLQRLIDEFQMTHEAVAAAVGKSRATVTNMLRLLELTEAVKTMLQNAELEMGHARALLTLAADLQIQAARLVVNKRMSVRETEKLVNRLQKPATHPEKPTDANIKQLERDLKDKLGAKVLIQHQHSGKGRLTINYNSLEELEGILTHIK